MISTIVRAPRRKKTTSETSSRVSLMSVENSLGERSKPVPTKTQIRTPRTSAEAALLISVCSSRMMTRYPAMKVAMIGKYKALLPSRKGKEMTLCWMAYITAIQPAKPKMTGSTTPVVSPTTSSSVAEARRRTRPTRRQVPRSAVVASFSAGSAASTTRPDGCGPHALRARARGRALPCACCTWASARRAEAGDATASGETAPLGAARGVPPPLRQASGARKGAAVREAASSSASAVAAESTRPRERRCGGAIAAP
mmetsp:Transcript_58441/g.161704  ORF Transcript_58441/g.161704 Transcript_58441/m.161704 type:complete len:256 (+) Transcript_58441:1139-1906(+)